MRRPTTPALLPALALAFALVAAPSHALVDFTGVTVLAAGENHNCAVVAGAVRCWGENTLGQLGDGTTLSHATPRPVAGITSAVAVTAGVNHSCALIADGTVRCWGNNASGQLGDGTFDEHYTPVPVAGLTGVVQLSAGDFHTCAVLDTGGVRCWGDNQYFQLGDGSTTTRPSPVAAWGVSGASAVAAGSAHSCAIVAGGTLMCWGNNSSGQFGDGTQGGGQIPVATPAVTGATSIAASSAYTCAVVAGGEVRCFGQNAFGSLGDGTATMRLTPVTAIGVSNATKVDAKHYATCARIADGTARCWGYNVAGQLGDGSTTTRMTPVSVAMLSNATTIANGGNHVCAVRADTTAACWGNNFYGEIGIGTTGGFETLPRTVKVEPGPAAGVTPSQLDFHAQVVGTTSVPQLVALTNAGGETLALVSIVPQGDYSAFHQCPASLAPGASCTLSITFTPTALGVRGGSVTITSNGAVSPVVLSLTVTGVAQPPPRVGLLAYVTHFASNYVSVVDTGAKEVVRTISVGQAPEGVAVASTADRVYVGNAGSSSVTIIDAQAEQAIATIGVGNAPRGLALSPDNGRLYVAASGSNRIDVVDTIHKRFEGSVALSDAPFGLALGENGSQLWVTHPAAGVVTVHSTQVLGAGYSIIPVMSQPFGIVASPDGARVYVANFGSNSVSIVDTMAFEVVGTVFVDSGPFALALSPDGATLYVSTNQNTVSVVDTATRTKIGSIPVGNHPQGLSVTPDGAWLYVANLLDGTVTIQPLPAGIPKTLTLGDGPVAFGQFIAPATPAKLAIEYFHAGFGHYFVTADPDEIAGIDAGAYDGAWTRTGLAFKVFEAPTATTSPVCRFFSVAFAPKSTHFYTPYPNECEIVKQDPAWQYEKLAFDLELPVGLGGGQGTCRPGTVPLYRFFNAMQGNAPNHRYTNSLDVAFDMAARGWILEGEAFTRVFACIPP
jgi:YVTN family beta-propeller protein